ncbi:MAG: PAS domain S-box protein [Candidatus Firestonebacteria bacterium]|nr:PAS domain S-box protein [Candidatus Firestonebacteria bacterium]
MKNFELLSKIALMTAGADDNESQLNYILEKTAEHINVSRVYIFWDNEAGTATSNIFEWCNAGILPQIDNLQNIPYELIPSWKDILLREGRIYSENIHELPADLVAVLEPQGIISLLVYPLLLENKYSGFIGFDECKILRKWEESEIKLLKTLSDIISALYERRIMKKCYEEEKKDHEIFFNTVDDLAIVADKEGRIVHVNTALVHKLGYSLEELKQMRVLDLHPEDKRAEAAKIINAMLLGERTTCPLELGSKDKRRIPVETRVWFGKWDNQDCIFGLSKDLSKEQEALQKFTKFFENNPALMAISSMTGQGFLEVNKAFSEKLGYSKEEILGKTTSELGIFLDQEKYKSRLEEFTKNGFMKSVEMRVACKDGRILNGVFSGEIIENQGKKWVLTVMLDVTAETALAGELLEQKQRLEKFISGTQLGTWEWNVKTGAAVFNERWAQIIGYTLEELAPVSIETWQKYSHSEDLKKSNELLQRCFRKETEYYEFECRMRHKNGSWIWVADRGRVTEWEAPGRPLKMFGTHTDITEKKKLQEKLSTAEKKLIKENSTLQKQLRHAVKMEAVGTLTANIAHDFNNMLGVVIGYSDLSLKLAAEKTKIADNLKEIKKAAVKAANLTSKLLSFTRKEEFKYKAFSLNHSLLDIQNMIMLIAGTNIEIELVLDAALKDIEGDKDQIDQVIINLVTNASHAMPEGGKLTIKTENIALDEKVSKNIPDSRPGKFICLSVLDTGVGMNSEQVSRIFEPFYTTKTDGEGTGLGLPMVSDIVKQHKGWINVCSNIGRGTEFKIFFLRHKESLL